MPSVVPQPLQLPVLSCRARRRLLVAKRDPPEIATSQVAVTQEMAPHLHPNPQKEVPCKAVSVGFLTERATQASWPRLCRPALMPAKQGRTGHLSSEQSRTKSKTAMSKRNLTSRIALLKRGLTSSVLRKHGTKALVYCSPNSQLGP